MLDYYYYSDWAIYSLRYRQNNLGIIYNSAIEQDADFIAKSLNMSYEDLINICKTFSGNLTVTNTLYFNDKENIENAITTLNIFYI